MLRISKQIFRWRPFYSASGFSCTTLPKQLPDHTNVVSVDFFRKKLESAGHPSDSAKFACPLFSFRESVHRTKGQQLNYVQGIIADFDSLPTGFSSYTALREHLKVRHPDAVVFPSPTGKAKVCWFVRSYRQSITDAAAIAFLEERLGSLMSWVDTSSAALSVALLDAQAIAAFAEFDNTWGEDDSYLQELPGSEPSFIPGELVLPSNHVYKAVTLDKLSPRLLEILSFATISMTPKQKEAFAQLLCILSACPAMLTEEGMGLSTVILSKQLDITPPTAGKWLKQLCDIGFIRWTGNKARANVKAKHYVAKHVALIDSIERNKIGTRNTEATSGNSLVQVIRHQMAEHGNSMQFRLKASYYAASQGNSLEELVEAINQLDPTFFTTMDAKSCGKKVNKRHQELSAAYRGAMKKISKAS